MTNQLGVTNDRLAITSGQNLPQHMDYVTDVSIRGSSAREHYYCWLSRFVAFLAIISLMFFASASLVLFKLAPEVQIEPFLIIRQSDSDDMVRYEAISPTMPSSKQMMELFIRQYVILRNTVVGDRREMQSRWYGGGMINYLSSGKVFAEFSKNIENKLMKTMEDNVSVDVEIISVGKTGGDRSPVWKVDFKTYELSPNIRNETTREMVLKTTYWTASLQAVFVPERMFMSKRLINPLGFTVIRYNQVKVEIL